MRKEIALIVAAGCIGASAATSNYDLLGRRGSQMNSPMVYKNIDYAKTKKENQQKNEPLPETRSLQKSGMKGSYSAIAGTLNTFEPWYRRLNLMRCPASGSCSSGYYERGQYLQKANEAFISAIPYLRTSCSNPPSCSQSQQLHNYPAKYPYTAYTAHTEMTNNTTYASTFNQVESGYGFGSWLYLSSSLEPGANRLFNDRSDILCNLSKYCYVSDWLDGDAGDIGVFMGVDALPVRLGNNAFVPSYFKPQSGESYNPAPGYEKRESQTYALLTAATTHASTVYAPAVNHAHVYVGKTDPKNPANAEPQIVVGVRNNNIGTTKWSAYNAQAKALDNFIYQYRTLEFVPSGNYGHVSGQTKMFGRALAANAVTVGAVHLVNQNGNYPLQVAPYTSVTAQNYEGVQKPEIYNFDRMYGNNEMTRTYRSDMVYPPLYDGTEVAATLTAGMAANLLASNPFYYWHPEVVKALLLSSRNGHPIASPYVNNQVTETVPDYEYLVFSEDVMNKKYDYVSKYWNGDINKLRTRVLSNGKSAIDFFIENPNYGLSSSAVRPINAAIAWLNSGDDIEHWGGATPQDFDLHVFGSPTTNVNDILTPPITTSSTSENSYEMVENITNTNVKYLMFRIVLYADHCGVNNVGQIALGFNMSRRVN